VCRFVLLTFSCSSQCIFPRVSDSKVNSWISPLNAGTSLPSIFAPFPITQTFPHNLHLFARFRLLDVFLTLSLSKQLCVSRVSLPTTRSPCSWLRLVTRRFVLLPICLVRVAHTFQISAPTLSTIQSMSEITISQLSLS
jgi:hypothetical protein